MGAATPPDLGVSRTVLLAGPITARKSAGRKQRTYRPTSLKGEFKRSPANSFTPSPSAPLRWLRRIFLMAQPLLLSEEGKYLRQSLIPSLTRVRASLRQT